MHSVSGGLTDNRRENTIPRNNCIIENCFPVWDSVLCVNYDRVTRWLYLYLVTTIVSYTLHHSGILSYLWLYLPS